MYTTGYYVGDVCTYWSSGSICSVVLQFVAGVLLCAYKERYSAFTFLYAVSTTVQSHF